MLPVPPPSHGGLEASGPDFDRTTTGNGHLPLISNLISPAKCRNPRDPVPGSSSQASVRVFTTDPRRLWDFLERTGVETCPLTGNETAAMRIS